MKVMTASFSPTGCDSGINSNFAENVLKVILTKFLHAEYGVGGGGLVSMCEAEVPGAPS